MKISDFFQKFYFSRSVSGLISYKSKEKIVEFFFTSSLSPEHYSQLPDSRSSFSKWMEGSRKPQNSFLSFVSNHFLDSVFVDQLYKQLDENRLPDLLKNFDIIINNGESPDKRRFANAIKEQFKALVAGMGDADNIVPRIYNSQPEPAGYETYLWKAVKKYKYMNLPGEDECLLSSYHVCNDIGLSAVVFPRKTGSNPLQNATLSSIQSYDKRMVINRALLIGACGLGKTLMLQRLFVDAALEQRKTGLLPVFAELRNFTNRYDDFVVFIVDTIQEYDTAFTRENAIDLLSHGKMQVLLDGLDELDPDEVKHFQKKLQELCSRYPDNQIVVTSRQCSAISGLRKFGFVSLYLQPMDEQQINTLIEKLLPEGDDDAKRTVESFFDSRSGYVPKNSFIASNPLLLTIIVRNYQQLKDFSGDRIKFYELLYQELIRGHDEEKPAFDRIFHSVYDGREFTEAYRELCAKAFVDGIDHFDQRSFEKYFKKLKCKDGFRNPAGFQFEKFQHDVCATACMMYEQDSGIFYIDHGFQDFFFAEYYYYADTDPTKEIARVLNRRHPDSFRNLNAFRMLYQMSPEKVETCFFLPFLENIYKKKNEKKAFASFLNSGYGNVKYTIFDDQKVLQYAEKKDIKPTDFYLTPAANHLESIIMALVLDVLHLPNTFIIGAKDAILPSTQFATHFYVGAPIAVKEQKGETAFGHWIINAMKIDIKKINDPEFYVNTQMPMPVLDENDVPVIVGYEYIVAPAYLIEHDDIYELFKNPKIENGPYTLFTQVRDYYNKIAAKQSVNEYR